MQHGQLIRKRWLSELVGSSPADCLSAAIENGNKKEFCRLLRSEVSDLHKCLDSRGLGPLHVAVLAGEHKMARTLLRYQEKLRLDLNAKSKNGWTALQFAAVYYGMNSKAAKMLVRHGSDVHQLTVVNARLNDGCQCKLNSFLTRIHGLSCPCPSTITQFSFNHPHSLQVEEITSRLPEINPQFAIDALLQCGAIYRYHPAGSSDVRYCFPAYFPTKLPEDPSQDSHEQEVNAGRFLVPLCESSQVNVAEVLHKLLLQVLSKIGEPLHVSETSFIFTSQSSKCLLAIHSTPKGIMIRVQSQHFTTKSFSHCCDILEYLIGSAQRHASNCFSCSVVSSHDLRRNLPNPHIYSTTEVADARRSGVANLQHPNGVEETFCDLLLEKRETNMQETPSKHQTHATPYDGQHSQSVKRQLQYPITTASAGHYWPPGTCRAAIEECYKDLIRYMKPELVIQILVQAHCFSAEEASEIISHPSHTHQCMFLLGILERKGDRGYCLFFQALKDEQDHRPHRELWVKLIETCKYLTEEPLEPEDESELCETPTGILGCCHESIITRHRSDTGVRSLSSYSDNSGSCAHTPLASEVESSLDSGIQSQTQSRTRRSLERKRKLKRPDNHNTPGTINAQAATFTGSSYKPRQGFTPLTVTIQRKSVADSSPTLASPTTTTSTASHQGTGTTSGILHDHFLPGHDYRHMRKHDGLGDFLMNDLDADQQPNQLLPPIPDMDEETENLCTNDSDTACKSSVSPPTTSAPIDVPLSRKSPSATETSSASSSLTGTSNLSQSSTSSCLSLGSNLSNSPKELSSDKSWKSSVLNFLHKFNPFSQDTRTFESSKVRTSHQQHDKYMLGLGFRM